MCPSNNFYPEQHRERKCLIKPWPPETHWAIQAKFIGSGQGDMSKASTPPSLPPQNETERENPSCRGAAVQLCREESSCLLEEEEPLQLWNLREQWRLCRSAVTGGLMPEMSHSSNLFSLINSKLLLTLLLHSGLKCIWTDGRVPHTLKFVGVYWMPAGLFWAKPKCNWKHFPLVSRLNLNPTFYSCLSHALEEHLIPLLPSCCCELSCFRKWLLTCR